ncbi:hypothetical protein, partial [Exiguobacterium chiriqhucha]|uniref:hypothetical protein n=1 Tax=Exiguobacterium chiriqhucha TaxID=1385984 RepID=UPI001F22908B
DSVQKVLRSMEAIQSNALQDSLQKVARSMEIFNQSNVLQESLKRAVNNIEMFKISSEVLEKDILLLDKKMLSFIAFEDTSSEMIIGEEIKEEIEEEVEHLIKTENVLSTEVLVCRLIIMLQCLQMVGVDFFDSDAVNGLTAVLMFYLDRSRK